MKRTALKADPEKVRQFINRNRGSLSRGAGTLERKPLKRTAKKRRASVPKALRARVYARSDGLCVCGCGRRCSHLHHVLRVEKSDWAHLELVEQVMVGLHWQCHQRHEFEPNGRLPFERLPKIVVDYVRGLGEKAEAELVRYHPRTDV